MAIIGVADTTFARVDMASFVIPLLKGHTVERYTVPGIKDLPVACKILFSKHKCDIVIALGMPGPEPVDKQCSHEASLGIQEVQLSQEKHILEVFVHMDEAKDDEDLFELCKDRGEKHALNAIALLKGKEILSSMAGSGRRQGRDDVGQITK